MFSKWKNVLPTKLSQFQWHEDRYMKARSRIMTIHLKKLHVKDKVVPLHPTNCQLKQKRMFYKILLHTAFQGFHRCFNIIFSTKQIWQHLTTEMYNMVPQKQKRTQVWTGHFSPQLWKTGLNEEQHMAASSLLASKPGKHFIFWTRSSSSGWREHWAAALTLSLALDFARRACSFFLWKCRDFFSI